MKRWIILLLTAFLTSNTLSIGASLNMESVEPIIVVSYEVDFNVQIPNSWLERSVASRCNNPGNLRDINTGSFRSYDNLMDGYTALLFDIECKQTGRSRYADSATTIQEFIFIYAPPFENDSHSYVRSVCETLDIDKKILIGSINKLDIARAIIKVEDPVLYKEMYTEIKTIKIIRKYE